MSDSDDFIADSSSALAATADLADDSSAAEPSTDVETDAEDADLDAETALDDAEVEGEVAVAEADVDVEADVAVSDADVAVEDVLDEAVAEEVLDDPLEEFRRQLLEAEGDWYLLHTYSGYEKRVRANIENVVKQQDLEDDVFQIEVPEETVWEVKQGQRKKVDRRKFPGYVLVRMYLTDETWTAIRNTPAVTGFVGQSDRPVPLPLFEVEKMLAPEPAAVEPVAAAAASGGLTPSAPKVTGV